jgi:hypothetical protein
MAMAAEPLMASCADEGTSNVKFHAMRKDGRLWVTLCGADSSGVTSMSQQVVPASSIEPQSRCRKLACRKAFAAADGVSVVGGQSKR